MGYLDDNPPTWRALLDAMADAVVVVNEDGEICHANRALVELSGYDLASLVARPVEMLIPESRRASHVGAREGFFANPRVRAMGGELELTLRRRDASECAVDIALSPLTVDGRLWAVASIRDATYERERWREQAEESLHFRLAFENSMAPMIFTDLADRVMAANDAFCTMLGRTREQLVGRDSQHFTHPDDLGITEDSHRQVILGEHDQMRYVKRYVHTNGSTIMVEVSRSPARDAEGNILYFVISERDVTEEHALTRQLSHQALHDPLTGLANRALIEDRLAQARERVRRQGGMGALLLVDLDDFKGVNDTHGHLVGDQLLVEVANRLIAVTRSSDTLCRFGGDEFLYLAEGLHNAQEADEIATRLLGALDEPFVVAGSPIEQHASIGVVAWDGDSVDRHEIIEDADVALYEAKRQGKGHHVRFVPRMHQRAVTHFSRLQELRRALHEGELVMHYQPIVDSAANVVVGFEALMRWRHRERGLVAPGDFLPLAEGNDLALDLGAFAMREATAAASAWGTPADVRPVFVTVNVSQRQFHDPGLVGLVSDALAASGLAPERLVVEVSEEVALSDVARTATVMAQLGQRGVGLALDNFGRGLSSLTSLVNLHPRFVKIDHSFVRPAGESAYNDVLLEAIVSLGTTLNMTVLAEGIETDEQLGRLRQHGCDVSQGFLFSPAVPANEVMAILAGSLDRHALTPTAPPLEGA